MARRLRLPSSSGWSHVMNRGVDRRSIFVDDRDRIDFGASIADAHERTGVDVHAYCLMPNHYHLVVRDRSDGLSTFMQHLSATFTQHLNARHGRDGPLFRGRFRSVPIEQDAQLMQTFRYVHRNPLALVSLDQLDGYRWSSHRTYLGARRPPDWLTLHELLDRFADVDAYRAFVAGPNRALRSPVELERLIDLLLDEHGDAGERATARRTVAILLGERHPMLQDMTAPLTSDLTSGSLRNARTRARRALQSDRVVAQVVAAIEREVGLSSTGSDPVDDGQAERSSPARNWAA